MKQATETKMTMQQIGSLVKSLDKKITRLAARISETITENEHLRESLSLYNENIQRLQNELREERTKRYAAEKTLEDMTPNA